MADPVDSLMNATGVVAVARAAGATAGAERARGEPPYLVYYRGSLEAGEIRGLGFESEVSEPGAWGRLLNGGASLEVEGRRVELLYRDLEVVEHWVAEAVEGRYERDEVEGWVAGMPTYLLAGELATAEALAGELPRPDFPDALRKSALEDWGRVVARALEVAEGLAA
ncbi:MAG: nucleotidyltransferase domain-containing protein, partial [Solirubrobacterales bacterium]